jgi:hypothetical protein
MVWPVLASLGVLSDVSAGPRPAAVALAVSLHPQATVAAAVPHATVHFVLSVVLSSALDALVVGTGSGSAAALGVPLH